MKPWKVGRLMETGKSRAVLFGAVVVFALLIGSLDSLIDPDAFDVWVFALDMADRLVTLGACAFVALLVSRTARLEAAATALRRDLGVVAHESGAWRARSRRLLESLSDAVAQQFRDWGLTQSEAEIAGLMLKGLPLRDIATLRRTSEATIRQQAQGIYRKSGLANRAELSAYFLEDLFDVAAVAVSEDAAVSEGFKS